ncbi:hypothetical protein CK203_092442 [Vitis vinifera]|uniref:DUF4283 domain-containing protein n=1 Tax=Vitis vinifera TaxID=29760 RepID=A0A438DY54_VITVI|nr:hypothetical protein CK203_092442 [Vitis vinifera]
MSMIRNQSVVVERKIFQVKSEDYNGGKWLSITERSQGFVVSLDFGEEETGWLVEQLEKAVELEDSRGYIRKMRGKTRTHMMEICFNSRGKVIASVQEISVQVGRDSQETQNKLQESKGMYRGERTYAEVVAEKGTRNGAKMPVGKWARAVGVFLWKMQGKLSGFKKETGVAELRGLPFHLWDEVQLSHVLQQWGRRLEDGDRTYTVAVTVTGEDDGEDDGGDSIKPESSRSKDELRSAGGCVLQKPQMVEGLRAIDRTSDCQRWMPRHRLHFSSSDSKSAKGEKGKGRWVLGQWREVISGQHQTCFFVFKAQRSGLSAKNKASEGLPQVSSKTKGSPVSVRRRARSGPPRFDDAFSSPKRSFEGGGSLETNRDISRGKSHSRRAISPLVWKHPKSSSVWAFEPNPIPETLGFFGSSFLCSLFFFVSVGVKPRFQCGSVSISPVVYDNHRGGEASFPVQEPSTLPLEGFQVEGLTPRKMVKVQSVLESLRVRIVRDNGKGVEGENRNPLSADKLSSIVQRSVEGGLLVGASRSTRLTFPRWCVGGDFNVIRRISEKMGDSRLTINMRRFDEFIRESGLLDPPLRNAAFTWSNMQVDPICKRFENMWLLHPEFKEKFRDWWQECTVEGWEGHKFMRKLKFIKSKLKEWNTRVFGDLRERKKHILTDLGRIDRIEQEGNLNLELVSEGS